MKIDKRNIIEWFGLTGLLYDESNVAKKNVKMGDFGLNKKSKYGLQKLSVFVLLIMSKWRRYKWW